jgi:ferric-dicitrate binding protein FerR (iron transport regulator)
LQLKRENFFKQGFRSSRIRSILSTHRQQQQQIEAKKTLYHNSPHLKRQKEEDRKQKKRRRRRRRGKKLGAVLMVHKSVGFCFFLSFFSAVVPEAFE